MISSDRIDMASTRSHSLILALAVIMLSFYSETKAQNQYPDWFLHSQQYPELIIGYSTAKVLSAEEDAIWRYSFLKKGFLSGTASYFNHEDKWEKDYITEALIPLLREGQLTKLAQIPTSMYAGGEEIVLFGMADDAASEINKFKLENVDKSPPKWVGKGPFFRNGEYYYGVGQYVLKGNENDAWRTAEERALVELASAIGIDISNTFSKKKSIQQNKSTLLESESINITTYTFDHEFTDAQVIERWIDYPEKNPNLNAYAYVLVKINSNNIKHNLSRGK